MKTLRAIVQLVVGVAAAVALLSTALPGAGAGPRPPDRFPLDRHYVFFGPVPPRPPSSPATLPSGSADYMQLFSPTAEWPRAMGRVDGFKIHGWMVRWVLTDDELVAIDRRLTALGIDFVIEAEPLSGPDPDRCNHSESYEGPHELQSLRRLQRLGIVVDVIAVEQPFSYGHLLDIDGACRYEAEEVADEVATWAAQAREIFPEVQVGSIEGLSPSYGTDATNLAHWLDVYENAAGEPFAFLHLDVDWRSPTWASDVLEIEDMAAGVNMPFGIIYNGDFNRSSDAVWLQTAAEYMAEYEVESGGSPDHLIIQSWVELPARVLPETDPLAFTSLINRYFGIRAELTVPSVTGTGAGGTVDEVVGSLLDTSGNPIASATINAELTPLDGRRQLESVSGVVPTGADRAVVQVLLNPEPAEGGDADVRIYSTGYTVFPSIVNHVPNPHFADGLAGWNPYGATRGRVTVEPSDDVAGEYMLRLTATQEQRTIVDTDTFTVVPGDNYEFTTEFAVPFSTNGTSEIAVIFLDAAHTEIERNTIGLDSTGSVHVSGRTDSTGRYSIEVPDLETGVYTVEVNAPGDIDTWPARVSTTDRY